MERERDGAGERPHRERLGHARRPFEQHVPVDEQPDEHAVDEPLLADDDAADLGEQRLDERAARADQVRGCAVHAVSGVSLRPPRRTGARA